jgi:hypothetical protein
MSNIIKSYIYLYSDVIPPISDIPEEYTDEYGRKLYRKPEPTVRCINWKLVEEDKDTGTIKAKLIKTLVISPEVVKLSELRVETLTLVLDRIGVDYKSLSIDS